MTINNQDSLLEGFPSTSSSPYFIRDENLYINASEWHRLCVEKDAAPLVSLLRDVHGFLLIDPVRLIAVDGTIELSADNFNEFQKFLDKANLVRANLGLALAIPHV